MVAENCTVLTLWGFFSFRNSIRYKIRYASSFFSLPFLLFALLWCGFKSCWRVKLGFWRSCRNKMLKFSWATLLYKIQLYYMATAISPLMISLHPPTTLETTSPTLSNSEVGQRFNVTAQPKVLSTASMLYFSQSGEYIKIRVKAYHWVISTRTRANFVRKFCVHARISMPHSL